MKNQSFFQKRSVAATIGIIALIAGFYFLNFYGAVNPFTGKVTGNFILTGLYPFSIISIIGLLLILCGAILIVYAIVKKG